MSKRISETKLKANRENATHSTGPKTEEGKKISSHNALKTGLTGRTVLLPTDDVADTKLTGRTLKTSTSRPRTKNAGTSTTSPTWNGGSCASPP